VRKRIPSHLVLLVLIMMLAFGTRALRCGQGLPDGLGISVHGF